MAPSDAPIRLLAEQAFSRVAGAPLVEGNAVGLLIDARANFDAWFSAIRTARTSIFVENYIFGDDEVSRELRDLLSERAAAGVRVFVIRDWLGCVGESRDGFWAPLRSAGGEVRTYNPIHVSSPFGWLSRDHRKLVVVDSDVAFVSGVCVSARWLGDEARGVTPWRDTGISVRGPAVRDLAVSFAEGWGRLGEALPSDLPALTETPPVAGGVPLRVIATQPTTTGVYRLDQLIASIAQRSLWLTDAYFVGLAPYVQALIAAARDGVDVRLLVPGTSDVPIVSSLTRAGYRALLEGGVRIYEWNGMLHAKTAVIDGRWARVGSSNLNIASWMGNCELDVAIEDEGFARRMHEQYERDLENATEIVLHAGRTRRAGRAPARHHPSAVLASKRSGRATAGALRLANTVGAAIADRRVLGATENSVLLGAALALLAASAIAIAFPRLLAWPLAVVALWAGLGLLTRWIQARRRRGPTSAEMAGRAAAVERHPRSRDVPPGETRPVSS